MIRNVYIYIRLRKVAHKLVSYMNLHLQKPFPNITAQLCIFESWKLFENGSKATHQEESSSRGRISNALIHKINANEVGAPSVELLALSQC